MSLLLQDVDVGGTTVDVLVEGDVIAEVAGAIEPSRADALVAGAGGALIPGLHDHHLHLLAMAAAIESVDCSTAGDADELRAALCGMDGDWVRAVGYHESIAGELDRHRLDEWMPDRPLRVQHRSGALWVLNTLALARVAHALDHSTDVERDQSGEPTGRLWRFDARLRTALPPTTPDLTDVGRLLAKHGITGVTDATPDLDQSALDLLADANLSGALPQHVTVLGAGHHVRLPGQFRRGPWKLMLRDHDLPDLDALTGAVREAHVAGRPVAVHCVSLEALALTLSALVKAGPLAGDRLEHAAVAPPALIADAARLGLTIVTQPDFLRTRGDRYLAEVDTDEQPWLYPYASAIHAGIPVAASSDAPFGELDPWAVMRSARDRLTASGTVIAATERVGVPGALLGYWSCPEDPGGRPRRIAAGEPADLCLLDRKSVV